MGTSSKKSCKTATVMNLISRRPEGANPALGAVPESDTVGQREQIEYIDIDRIDDDPRNFYELSGLDELAANIELLGLQQPIRVRPGEEPGRYVIVSGHRRRAAIAKLVEGGREDCRLIPCIVERNQESAALQELRLIYANSDTRRMTAADISRQAERVEALLYQLKEEGYEFPGRMRDHVAAACKVSKSKLARLDVIRKNLDKCWRTGWEKGKLAESTAYALAQMPQDRQRVIFDGLKGRGEYPASAYEGAVTDYGERLAQAEKIQCKTYGNGPCLNREAMQRRIMDEDSWAYNNCRQCCDKCGELAKCKYACPMLADKVKRLKADAKARKQQEQAAQEERERPQVDQIKALWKRFGEARAAAGKPMEACLEALDINFRVEEKVREWGKLERLEGTFRENTQLPYSYNCWLGDVRRYVKLADLLGVSLDYLLCRTDDPAGFAPGSGLCDAEGQLVFNGWMPGGTLPRTPCNVVADFDLGEGAVSRILCRFDGRHFKYASIDDIIEVKAVRWMMLPPVVPDSDTGEGTACRTEF